MSRQAPWRLFEVVGVEMEYMIVDRESLEVLPVADDLLREAAGTGEFVEDFDNGPIAWSNEIVCHLVELKTNGPAPSLTGLAAAFHADVTEVNRRLASRNAMLMGTGAHPLMNPETDTRIWPHGDRQIYFTYDRIFGCRGHGWSNLQSTHLNLPFADDREFGQLHAAIRLVLPLIPALAASSPLLDGRSTGYLDARLETYRHNQQRVASITGRVVPERLFSRADYEGLFDRLRSDIAPYDPDRILDPLFLNSRGAIARFDRNAIEIRVVDIQECPRADIAVAAAIIAAVQGLVNEDHVALGVQQEWPEDLLADILMDVVRDGDAAPLRDPDYLRMFGLRARTMTAGEVWRSICESARDRFDEDQHRVLSLLLSEGPLARRILRTLGPAPAREAIIATYAELARCLAANRPFA